MVVTIFQHNNCGGKNVVLYCNISLSTERKKLVWKHLECCSNLWTLSEQAQPRSQARGNEQRPPWRDFNYFSLWKRFPPNSSGKKIEAKFDPFLFCVVHLFLCCGDVVQYEGIFSGKKCQVSQFCWKCGPCVPAQVASFRLMFTFVAFKWTRFSYSEVVCYTINIKHPRDICQSEQPQNDELLLTVSVPTVRDYLKASC